MGGSGQGALEWDAHRMHKVGLNLGDQSPRPFGGTIDGGWPKPVADKSTQPDGS